MNLFGINTQHHTCPVPFPFYFFWLRPPKSRIKGFRAEKTGIGGLKKNQSCIVQQGGRRELRNGRCLRSRRPGRASYCTRGRGKFGNREKRSVLENSFCSFFRTPDSCQEAPPPPLLLFPFFPLSFPSLCIFFFPSIFG